MHEIIFEKGGKEVLKENEKRRNHAGKKKRRGGKRREEKKEGKRNTACDKKRKNERKEMKEEKGGAKPCISGAENKELERRAWVIDNTEPPEASREERVSFVYIITRQRE